MDFRRKFSSGNRPKSGSPVPVLHCRGTHYEIGLQVGKEFRGMIQDLLLNWAYFNDVVLKAGSTSRGQKRMEESLRLCQEKFPGYLDEIRGMAKGAEIPFEQLFMLNIDSILRTCDEVDEIEAQKIGATGCTTVINNKDEVILGHTEDALAEIKDHIYIVSAEIVGSDEGTGKENILEKFTTLCYAGTLMGYTMGFNSHGMIYSVNTIFPTVCPTGTPRSFIARAVLGATDLQSLINLLKDKGNGISDGFSLNVCFHPKVFPENSKPISFYNIEVAPPQNGMKESIVDILELGPGKTYIHCNRYLRVNAKELKKDAIVYSNKRHAAIIKRGTPSSEQNVKEMLSDQTDYHYPVFNDGREDGSRYEMDFIRTVAAGIFNIQQKTWSVYTTRPTTGSPDHTFKIA